jgi:hypothetical protein
MCHVAGATSGATITFAGRETGEKVPNAAAATGAARQVAKRITRA